MPAAPTFEGAAGFWHWLAAAHGATVYFTLCLSSRLFQMTTTPPRFFRFYNCTACLYTAGPARGCAPGYVRLPFRLHWSLLPSPRHF
jgi:hypothetical protein